MALNIADKVRDALQAGADDALHQAARQVLQHAQRNAPIGDPELDPDPTTSLRDSGRIERTHYGYRIIFDTPYAAKVEFDVRLKHPRGGGAHYLRRAVTTVQPQLEGIIAGKVRARA